MEGWDNFFLGGLLFVAASLNLSRILQFPGLPERALAALALLLGILVLSSLMLVPGQPTWLIGVEALATGLVLAGLGLRIEVYGRGETDAETRRRQPLNIALYGLAVVPYALGGLVLILDGFAGLYFIAAAIVLSIVKAVLDAWVLLVEINR